MTAVHQRLTVKADDCRLLREALIHRRQFTGGHLILQRWRLDQILRLALSKGGPRRYDQNRRQNHEAE